MNEILQFGKLNLKIEKEPHQVTYHFQGEVDEHFNQADVPRIKSEMIIFDLKEIYNFNSCGIREWIYFLNAMQDTQKGGQIVFRRCSVTMMDQINMIPNTLGNATIESFFAPYYCNRCDIGNVDKLIYFQDKQEQLANSEAPKFNCPKCTSELEFDAIEDVYFTFAHDTIPKAG